MEQDNTEHKFVHGVMGIFGHGNVTGLGEALEYGDSGLRFIQGNNEQGLVHAATAFAKQKNRLGIYACTSSIGPGATNMITGVCCAYYDSVPVLYITGQVATFRLKGERGVRQLGFQETDIVGMFRPVTKYAQQLTEPNEIQEVLELAYNISLGGRPGPVLVDIPDNFWTEEIELSHFNHSRFNYASVEPRENIDAKIEKCLSLINDSTLTSSFLSPSRTNSPSSSNRFSG